MPQFIGFLNAGLNYIVTGKRSEMLEEGAQMAAPYMTPEEKAELL